MRTNREQSSLRVFIESFPDDLERYPGLRLCAFQPVRLDVLVEERGDLGIEGGAEGAQRGGVIASCRRRLL